MFICMHMYGSDLWNRNNNWGTSCLFSSSRVYVENRKSYLTVLIHPALQFYVRVSLLAVFAVSARLVTTFHCTLDPRHVYTATVYRSPSAAFRVFCSDVQTQYCKRMTTVIPKIPPDMVRFASTFPPAPATGTHALSWETRVTSFGLVSKRVKTVHGIDAYPFVLFAIGLNVRFTYVLLYDKNNTFYRNKSIAISVSKEDGATELKPPS